MKKVFNKLTATALATICAVSALPMSAGAEEELVPADTTGMIPEIASALEGYYNFDISTPYDVRTKDVATRYFWDGSDKHIVYELAAKTAYFTFEVPLDTLEGEEEFLLQFNVRDLLEEKYNIDTEYFIIDTGRPTEWVDGACVSTGTKRCHVYFRKFNDRPRSFTNIKEIFADIQEMYQLACFSYAEEGYWLNKVFVTYNQDFIDAGATEMVEGKTPKMSIMLALL